MKGVILAGGLGTRLSPSTKVTNKHLLPVYDRPMIFYPIETLKKSGVREILIVCGKEHSGDFSELLGGGEDLGVSISYTIQVKDNGGISDALSYAKYFSANDSLAVILGDNIFEDSFKKEIKDFNKGARIFIKKVKDPERYGVLVFDKKGEAVKVEEKPKKPKSEFAQTGLYLFDNSVFERIKKLNPSKRGELEVSDLVNTYIKDKKLSYGKVKGYWLDAGTHDALLDAAVYIKKASN